MIHITAVREHGSIRSVTCEGHALYDEPGSDIICAAVSALMINTANSIEQFTEDDLVIEEGGEEGGYLMLRLDGEISESSALLLKSLMLGLHSIKDTYGEEFLQITQQERSE